MNEFNWTCPYCGRPTTVTEPNFGEGCIYLGTVRSRHESCVISWVAIACPNPNCKELTLTVILSTRDNQYGNPHAKERIALWRVMPLSQAKPLPDYIPQEIRSTYEEACLTVSASPRASAAMSRRCLQGIARDFWKIPDKNRGNLGAELAFIKDKVDHNTWEAIDAVRSVGDIGAHMEKDVNLIIDVQPHEAKLLIELIETLFEDWYIERDKRETRNSALKGLANAKLQEKKDGKKLLKASVAIEAPEAGDASKDNGN